MSKAVLISIRPEWVAKILSREKTLEVRKTRPNMGTPFKCYIYCTNNGGWLTTQEEFLNRKVVAEFVCDRIDPIVPSLERCGFYDVNNDFVAQTCLVNGALWDYGNGSTLYCWHISDLKIYRTPLLLKNFRKPCIYPEMPYCPACKVGYEYISDTEAEFYLIDGTCNSEWICQNFLSKAPQSWCYVEEIGDE